MCDGVADHGKQTWKNVLIHGLFLLLLGLGTSKASAEHIVSINVYLKLKNNNPIERMIKHFYTQLKQSNANDFNYYLDKHPLHLTLYLTQYNINKRRQIINLIQQIANQTHAFNLTSNEIITNKSTYTFVSVTKTKKLKDLANQVTYKLMKLRSMKNLIPNWAKNDINRVKIYQRYGSPNVGPYFSPHFSLLQSKSNQLTTRLNLRSIIQKNIERFQCQNIIRQRARVQFIAVGYANEEGQIVKEIIQYPLT